MWKYEKSKGNTESILKPRKIAISLTISDMLINIFQVQHIIILVIFTVIQKQ